jgi:surfeit locus 1 family protein
MHSPTKNRLPDWTPYALGGAFVLLFLVLSGWQLSRGLEKQENEKLFDTETGFAAWSDGMEPRPYQQLKVSGRFDTDHQVLIENMVMQSQLGYHVITPLVVRDGEPLLLINRGWVPTLKAGVDTEQLALPEQRVTLLGRAGRLPRIGMKMGDAFQAGGSWPKLALFPTYEEIEQALGREVQPFVLLLDAENEFGFAREWQANQLGPDRHFGYALQWIAMAAMLAGLLIWNYRKKGFESD